MSKRKKTAAYAVVRLDHRDEAVEPSRLREYIAINSIRLGYDDATATANRLNALNGEIATYFVVSTRIVPM
jgi:hypothetical protein